jgi:hypothetical protein
MIKNFLSFPFLNKKEKRENIKIEGGLHTGEMENLYE